MASFQFRPPFAAQNAALKRLSDLTPRSTSSDCPLADDIWVSLEEGAGAELHLSGGSGGLNLDLVTIGRSDWLSLSFAIPLKTVRSGRYVAFVITTRTEGFVSYRPCLRYILNSGGFEDRFCRDYVVTSGGQERQLSHVETDAALAEQAKATEAHLFFQGTRFQVNLPHIEALLIP